MRFFLASLIFLGMALPAQARHHHYKVHFARSHHRNYVPTWRGDPIGTRVVEHPSGCPRRQFCGCGTAMRIFGAPIRSLWLAANWFRFPRASAAAGMVAVRRHHVFAIEQVLGAGRVLAYDPNSGRGLTRIHATSLAGYTVVNPRGGSW
jgi:hypothetical protein